MKILLHSNQLGLGGTESTLWDLACGCEEILGHSAIIATSSNPPNSGHPGFGHNSGVVEKFKRRFPVFMYDGVPNLNFLAGKNQVDVGYFVKSGENDGVMLYGAKTVIHIAFPVWEPHGDVYAYSSEWLSKVMTNGRAPWISTMIRPIQGGGGNWRGKLGIPEEAVVFGGYGRSVSFDIPFVHETVCEVASSHPHIYFVFNSFKPFGPQLKNVIFLPEAADLDKAALIDTCDAMLHGRARGETFGNAVGEWATRNKPVLTYSLSPETAHIDLLGSSALLYENGTDLRRLLLGFRPNPEKRWESRYEECTPEKVMERFKKVFLT